MNTRLKVYGLLLGLILGGAGLYYASKSPAVAEALGKTPKKDAKAAKKAGDEVIPVELADARKGPISAYLTSTANLKALRDVEVASQSEGVVRRIGVEEGDFVQQGQVLCQLDDNQLQVDLKLAEERLEQARLQLEKARIAKEKAATQAANSAADLKRKEQAFAEQLVSAQEVDDVRYRLEEFQHDERSAASGERESRHRVEELEAEIAKAKLLIAHSQVRAPFAGRITQRMVELGKTVRNMDPVFRLASFSPLQAEVHLSEQESHRVEPGQTVAVRLGNETTNSVAGKVIRVSPVVDGATGTVKVTVELQPKDEGFKPGAFVRVDIETDAKSDAILVPRRAIIEDEGETYLFVAEGEKAFRKKVTLGYEWEGDVEVREGVTPGQKIVVAGQGSLKEGDKIRVIEG